MAIDFLALGVVCGFLLLIMFSGFSQCTKLVVPICLMKMPLWTMGMRLLKSYFDSELDLILGSFDLLMA